VLIVSDAWYPQTNGVVRSLETVKLHCETIGHEVSVIGPDRFRTLPCPTYPDIRLALFAGRRLAASVDAFRPQAVHIATEGPLGWSARDYCLRRGYPFTTSFHTMFPEYLHVRFRVPRAWTYDLLRRFHGKATKTLVATPTLDRLLRARGFDNLVNWSRGVDTTLFRPRDKSFLPDPRPIQLFVGRVAVEKNLEAFLKLDTPGTKYVVGDGPQLADLKRRYPQVRFAGPKYGEELARYFAASDVFVFPSRTDTFGLVLLEALACGVPVAAFPVQGPLDIVGSSDAGCLDEDLGRAIREALAIPAETCRAHAMKFSWHETSEQFAQHLQVFEPD
jgi:glycosyltransferase involved in cell wall biosynthesis